VVVFAAKAIESTASLIVMMLLTRMLQLQRWGDFAFINAIVLAFQPLINLELNTILIREMARNRIREKALLGGGLLVKLCLVTLFVICAVILDRTLQLEPLLRMAFYLAVAGEVFQQVSWVYSTVFMARERMEFEPLLSLVFRVTSVGGIILTAVLVPRDRWTTTGFFMVFLIMAVSQALRATAGMVIASRFLKSFRVQWSFSVARELLHQSWIMGIATFCTGLTLRLDIYFLRYFKGSETVGLFHLPHMYSLQIQILAVSVVTALFPVMSRWAGDMQQKERYRKAQDLGIRTINLFGLSIAAVSVLFPEWIIRLLGGSAYMPAQPALIILAWIIPILFLNYLCTNLLITIQKQALLIYGAVVSLVLNTALDILWIPRYGIIGASVATVISYASQLMIVLILLKIHSRNPLHFMSAVGIPWLFCAGAAVLARYTIPVLSSTPVVDYVFRGATAAGIIFGMLALQPGEVRRMIVQSRRRSSPVPEPFSSPDSSRD